MKVLVSGAFLLILALTVMACAPAATDGHAGTYSHRHAGGFLAKF